MKIGFFDSGLGGLIIMHAASRALPDHDMVFLSDTLNVPYGNRSPEFVLEATRKAVEFLFKQECALVILACNTACAIALRHLQQNWLMDHYPDRRILGVIVPTLEVALTKEHTRIGLMATAATATSDVYGQELRKLNPDIKLSSQPCPLLVPMIENDGRQWVGPVLESYLEPLVKQNIQSLILGCTHYPFLKEEIVQTLSVMGSKAELISQDEIIDKKLYEYLQRHPEIDKKVKKGGRRSYYVTDLTETYQKTAQAITGQAIPFIKRAL